MTDFSNPWSFFDKIYCISIDTRIDRRTEAKKHFSEVDLLDRVEFVLVEKHPDNPEKGIFESHMKCLRKGLEAGAEHILVFEDDVFFKNYQPGTLSDAVHFLKNRKSWNVFFLGAISSKIIATDVQSVVKIHYTCLAHAYALNCHFAKQFVQESWNNVPYDNLLQKCCKEFYALSPMIAFQGRASSDNQTIVLDTIRRFFGGLPFIQRVNEFYQHHKTIIIAFHLCIITGLILLIMSIWK